MINLTLIELMDLKDFDKSFLTLLNLEFDKPFLALLDLIRIC